MALQKVEAAVDGLADRRLGLRIARGWHRGSACPHDGVPGLAFEPIGLADLCLGGTADQDKFAVLTVVQAVRVPEVLSLGLAVAAWQRDVDDARGHGEIVALNRLGGKPLGVGAEKRPDRNGLGKLNRKF